VAVAAAGVVVSAGVADRSRKMRGNS